MAFPTFCHDVKSALSVGVQILTDPSVLVSLPKGSDGLPADVGLFGYHKKMAAAVRTAVVVNEDGKAGSRPCSAGGSRPGSARSGWESRPGSSGGSRPSSAKPLLRSASLCQARLRTPSLCASSLAPAGPGAPLILAPGPAQLRAPIFSRFDLQPLQARKHHLGCPIL
eukprot:jgi/Tetstr1/466078/TSEL_010664.t1